MCFAPQKGNVQPVSVKVGEKVLLPEYGGTKVILDEKVQYRAGLSAKSCKICFLLYFVKFLGF